MRLKVKVLRRPIIALTLVFHRSFPRRMGTWGFLRRNQYRGSSRAKRGSKISRVFLRALKLGTELVKKSLPIGTEATRYENTLRGKVFLYAVMSPRKLVLNLGEWEVW